MITTVLTMASENMSNNNIFQNPIIIVSLISLIGTVVAGLLGIIGHKIYLKARINANAITQKADKQIIEANIKVDLNNYLNDIKNSVNRIEEKTEISFNELNIKNNLEHKEIVKKLDRNINQTNQLIKKEKENNDKKDFSRDIINIGLSTIIEMNNEAIRNKQKIDKRITLYLKAAMNNIKAFACEILDAGIENINKEFIYSSADFNIQVMQGMFKNLFGEAITEKYMQSGQHDRNRLLSDIIDILNDNANNKICRLQNATERYCYQVTSNFYSFYNNNKLNTSIIRNKK